MADSFVITISREYPLDDCLSAIDEADIFRKKLRLIVYIDSKDNSLINHCLRWVGKQRGKWKKIMEVTTYRNPVEIKKFEDCMKRWKRIEDNMRTIVKLTSGSEIVFMVEDDTIIPRDAFKKLYTRIKKDKKIGCIQGVEMMRGAGENGPCGAWKLKVVDGKVHYKIGLSAKKEGIEQIDGGGYYCWAFRRKAIKQIEFRSSLNGWCGPDIWTWYDLQQKGWKTLIDWSVWCGHKDKNGKIYTPEKTRNWLYKFYENGKFNDYSPKINYDYKGRQ